MANNPLIPPENLDHLEKKLRIGRYATLPTGTTPPEPLFSLDTAAAENRAVKTQDDWITYWNTLTDGRVMASMGDFYRAGKEADSKLLRSLQRDFNKNFLITSTRIYYDPDSLEATIIDYVGSTVVIPLERRTTIPAYTVVRLGEVLSSATGLAYLQTLLRTSDTADEIKKTLQRLSGKTSEETRVYTPLQGAGRNNLQRAARLWINSVRFDLDCIIDLCNDGCSRGVRLISPGGTL